MGGGPDREHMLIVLWNPEPKELIAKIKQRFPYIDVTYFQIKSTRANKVPDAEQGVPIGSYPPALSVFLYLSSSIDDARINPFLPLDPAL